VTFDEPQPIAHDPAARHPLSANQHARILRAAAVSRGAPEAWGTASLVAVVAFDLRGQLDVTALAHAIRRVSLRHDASRTSFVLGDPPCQVVAGGETELLVVEPVEEADRVATARLDLSTGPLARFTLAQVGEEHWRFWVTVERIVCDGFGLDALLTDLSLFYAAKFGLAPAPAERPVQNHDYAWWEREYFDSEDGQAAREYWHRVLDGKSPRRLLEIDGASVPAPHDRNQTIRHVRTLSARETAALKRAATSSRTTLFMLVGATVVHVLRTQHGAGDDISVMCPVANRDRDWLATIVSWIANVVPLRLRLRDGGVDHVVEQVREVVLDSLPHARYSVHQLMRELAPDDDWGLPQRGPALYVDVGRETSLPLALPGVHVAEVPPEESAVQLGLGVWASVGETIRLEVAHPRGYLEPERSAAIADAVAAQLHRF
jgi:Condensation domain